VDEIFKKQFKYKDGRYTIQSALSPPQRMQWIGSKHCAILFHQMYGNFGADYFVADYACGKWYGHMFCPAIGQFTSVQKFIVPMMAQIVKRFGWGEITPIKTDYKKNEYSFKFSDPPIGREILKLYGKQKAPVDSMVGGLLAGSMEHILNKKLIAIETECLAMGKGSCLFNVVSPEAAEKTLLKKLKGDTKEIAKRAIELEKKHDFLKESVKLVKGQNKSAMSAELKFLKG
jgi:predicted hydrocarbon binding protein